MDTSSVAVTIGSGLVISVVVQFLKALLERWIKPDDPVHDPAIQVLAGAIGVAGFLLHAWTQGHVTGPQAWDAASQGFLAGLSAIVTYHVLSSSPVMVSGVAVQGAVSQGAEPAPVGPLVPATVMKAEVVTPAQQAQIQPVPPGGAA